MPYTKLALQNLHSLSLEDVDATLNACGLPIDQDEYTEEEIQSGFDVIRGYFTRGQAPDYTVAAELFNQNIGGTQPQPDSQTKAKKSGKAKKPTNPLDISFLLSQAFEQSGKSVSLTQAVRILEACGLPDTEQYTQQECDRFVEACDLIEKQGKSYSEVAAHFGISGSNESKPDNLQQIVEQISDQAVSAESGLVGLVNKITEKRAEGIPGLVNKLFLKNVSRKLVESQGNNDMFFAELEERIMAQIEGKSPARSLEATWEWAPNSLPHSSPKPISLPEGSDNGISDE